MYLGSWEISLVLLSAVAAFSGRAAALSRVTRFDKVPRMFPNARVNPELLRKRWGKPVDKKSASLGKFFTRYF